MKFGEKVKQVVRSRMVEIAEFSEISPLDENERARAESPVAAVFPALSEAAPVVKSPTNAACWFTYEHGASGDVFPCAEYEGVLCADGTPEFDRLFQNVGIKPSLCDASAVIRILANMPDEVPPRIQRLTVWAMLDHLSQSDPAAVDQVRDDASQKITHVSRLADRVNALTDRLKAEVEKEIADREAEIAAHVARLEREITQRRAVIDRIDHRRDTVQDACRDQIARLHIAMSFCDRRNAPPATPHAAGLGKSGDIFFAEICNGDYDLPPALFLPYQQRGGEEKFLWESRERVAE